MAAYYNEIDKGAANWLRELIANGHIAPGDVDERSIGDVSAEDLRGYVQCHFFAGIGVWSHALRRAGWSDDRPVWTGSCPCQPFSAAGKGLGFEDPRHLWPDFLRLIALRRPDCIFGEQAATAGAWIDLVRSDLEARGYAFGSPDLPAAGFGGAHIRQRLYWVADADHAERWADLAPRHVGDWPETGRVQSPGDAEGCGGAGWLADAYGGHAGAEWQQRGGQQRQQLQDGDAGGTAYVARIGWRQEHSNPGRLLAGDPAEGRPARPGDGSGDSDWIACRDGLWRPVEPGSFPLVAEAPARLGRLRGYGNALDAEVATEFVAAFLEASGSNAVRAAA